MLMNPPARRFVGVLWVVWTLIFAAIFLAFLLANFRLRAFVGKPLPVLGQISDFTLTNQLARPSHLRSCAGMCGLPTSFLLVAPDRASR